MVRFFFFTATATTEIYTLSLHDALPIFTVEDEEMRDFTAGHIGNEEGKTLIAAVNEALSGPIGNDGKLEFHAGVSYRNIDRKSTRLNSSHVRISYAVFCLKKKTDLRPLT